MTDKTPPDAQFARAAENPVGFARLARILLDKGNGEQARRVALAALRAAPQDDEVRSMVAGVLARDVPDWHFRIVQDEARNAAYEAALARVITPHSKVLEIGTGTGILAMMAARAGAEDVVTCEIVPAIAETAREIIALNGYSDRVRVILKDALHLEADADLGWRGDIFVSEIVNNMIVGEGALPIVEHAARALLKPGAKIIPARGIVRVALGYDADIGRERMDTIDGFDLSPFNRLAAAGYRIKRDSERLTLLSHPADLFDFDFQSGGPFPEATASVTLASQGGRANGIAQWIALQMDAEGRYENDPKPGTTSAWAVIFWPFAVSRELAAGASVDVFGRHDRRALRIWS
jgi:type II protein arginine methyltransferase